jgi:hypothetical protein
LRQNLQELLSASWVGKDKFIELIHQNPDYIQELLDNFVSDIKPAAWRSAWLLRHVMNKNDVRIEPLIPMMISVLSAKEDGHQRELLLILEKMELSDENIGALFDECSRIWETISKKSSTRIAAMKVMLNIAVIYPELNEEIQMLTEDHYTETLSPGIKKMLFRMLNGS